MSIAEKLVIIAENQQSIYEAGVRAGQASSGSNDAFWDTFQQNGNRTDYGYAFRLWDGSIFDPKYSIAPVGDYQAAGMFYGATNMGDLKTWFENKGIVLDFSNAGRLNETFRKCTASKLPIIDLSNCTQVTLAFYDMPNLTELTMTNVRPDCTFDRAFNYSHALTTLNISGTIGKNGLTFAHNKGISAESLRNVFNILEDKTSDTSTTWTVTLGSHNLAKLTDEDKSIATSKGWQLV